jgi:hypothetical protein
VRGFKRMTLAEMIIGTLRAHVVEGAHARRCRCRATAHLQAGVTKRSRIHVAY